MSQTSANAASILKPESVQDLIIEPLTAESIAMQVSTVVNVATPEARFPLVTADPTAAWTAEAQEIDVTEATFDQVVAVPKKLAAITIVSNELAEDSSPAAAALIGQRLVEGLKRKLDAAYFGNTVANGPSGLQSITPTVVYGGNPYADADGFIEAVAAAEQLGLKIDTFVASPATVVKLAKLRKATGSNEPLLSDSAAGAIGRSIVGVPLLASPDVADGIVYGIPKSRSFVVLRKGATITVDSSAKFTSDATAIRAVLRADFAFPQEAAIVAVLEADLDAS